jgi:hypothetical protein
MVELRVINTAERSVAQALAGVKQSLGTKPWNPVFSVCDLFSFLLQRVVPGLAAFLWVRVSARWQRVCHLRRRLFLCCGPSSRSRTLAVGLSSSNVSTADEGAVLVVNGNGANADGNFISGFGMQETDGLDGLRCFHGTGDGTVLVSELAAGLIAMQQCFRDTATANLVVTQPATDALCAVAPKSQSFSACR